MKEYTLTEARENFASLLDEAKTEGAVCIGKQDGEAFYIRPEIPKTSPLELKGMDIDISAAEIVRLIRESRG